MDLKLDGVPDLYTKFQVHQTSSPSKYLSPFIFDRQFFYFFVEEISLDAKVGRVQINLILRACNMKIWLG